MDHGVRNKISLLLYITGHGPVRTRKYIVVCHKRAGSGSFMLAPGGQGCKTAGPCHLYPTPYKSRKIPTVGILPYEWQHCPQQPEIMTD